MTRQVRWCNAMAIRQAAPYSPTPSPNTGLITEITLATVEVPDDEGKTVEAIMLPFDAAVGTTYTMIGGTGSGYLVKISKVRTVTLGEEPVKVAYVGTGDYIVINLGQNFTVVGDLVTFPRWHGIRNSHRSK